VTVTATINGKPDTIINSTVHFTSSDPAALLPPDYYFTRADAGSHTFTNGFTLMTPGNQTISGAIHDATGIKGSATVCCCSMMMLSREPLLVEIPMATFPVGLVQ
jgi:hypothetical protein